MEFLLNGLANMLNSIANGAATKCAWFFYEAEVPQSLIEE